MPTVKLKESCYKTCDDEEFVQRGLSVLANVQIRILHLENTPSELLDGVELPVLRWVESMFEKHIEPYDRISEEMIED